MNPVCLDKEELAAGMTSILSENNDLCTESSQCAVSTYTLSQRLTVIERYLLALSRQLQTSTRGSTPKYKNRVTETNILVQKR